MGQDIDPADSHLHHNLDRPPCCSRNSPLPHHQTQRRGVPTEYLLIGGIRILGWPLVGELYIDLEFSRLHFGSRPIGPLNDDEALPHADCGDHAQALEGRPPTLPQQSDPSALGSNHTVLVSTRGNIPQPAEPPRYYNSQYLNLIGDNLMLATGLAPHECPAAEASNWILHNRDDPINDDDLPPLPTCPIPRQLAPIEPRNLSGELVPPLGHCIVTPPPRPANLVERTYMGWQEYFTKFHNCVEPNWGNKCSMAHHWGIEWWNITIIPNSTTKWDQGGVEWKWSGCGDSGGWARRGWHTWGTTDGRLGAVNRCLARDGPGSRWYVCPSSSQGVNAGRSSSFPIEREWSS